MAGISNLTVEWQLIGSDTAGEETTKAPSYIFGASVSLTGVVYVVVHAKNFNKQGAMPAAPFHGMGMPPFPPPMGPHGPITPGRPGYRGPQPEKGFPWPPPPSSARTVGTRISADSEKSASSYSRPTTPKHSPRGKTKPSRRPPPSTDTDFARSTRAPAPSTFVA